MNNLCEGSPLPLLYDDSFHLFIVAASVRSCHFEKMLSLYNYSLGNRYVIGQYGHMMTLTNEKLKLRFPKVKLTELPFQTVY